MNNREHLFIRYHLTLKLSPLPHFQSPKHHEINGFSGRAEIIRQITRFRLQQHSSQPAFWEKDFSCPCGAL